MKTSIRYCYEDVDRHGNVRLYFWRAGQRKVRIRAVSGTPQFWEQYNEALRRSQAGLLDKNAPPSTRLVPGTLRWLGEAFLRSPEITRCDARTQRIKRARLTAALAEPTEPGGTLTFGEVKLEFITPRAILIMRDRKASHPNAANSRLKVLRQMFKWAVLAEPDWVTTNPAREIPMMKVGGAGLHSWLTAEVLKYEAYWPVGTVQRLALALLLWTGTRRSDVVGLGPHSLFEVRGEQWIRYTSQKTKTLVEIPVLPELSRVLTASPTGAETFLVGGHGKPYTADGFGMRFREWCDAAGLPQCSAHGLRKAGAAIAAEGGASAHQLMAIFGWSSISEAERYTKGASMRRLAEDGMRAMGAKVVSH